MRAIGVKRPYHFEIWRSALEKAVAFLHQVRHAKIDILPVYGKIGFVNSCSPNE
jgi:hypothetical protein